MNLRQTLDRFQTVAEELKQSIPEAKIGNREVHDLLDTLRAVEQVNNHLTVAIRESIANWLREGERHVS